MVANASNRAMRAAWYLLSETITMLTGRGQRSSSLSVHRTSRGSNCNSDVIVYKSKSVLHFTLAWSSRDLEHQAICLLSLKLLLSLCTIWVMLWTSFHRYTAISGLRRWLINVRTTKKTDHRSVFSISFDRSSEKAQSRVRWGHHRREHRKRCTNHTTKSQTYTTWQTTDYKCCFNSKVKPKPVHTNSQSCNAIDDQKSRLQTCLVFQVVWKYVWTETRANDQVHISQCASIYCETTSKQTTWDCWFGRRWRPSGPVFICEQQENSKSPRLNRTESRVYKDRNSKIIWVAHWKQSCCSN